MRIGIFGGTFDPPHVGHLILAEEAQAQLELDRVLWMLTPFPPHKTEHEISSFLDRLAMVRLAITGNRGFKLSRVDIDREPPHYAVDSVAILREKSPNDEYLYLMGADSLNDLPTWHEPIRFVSLCHGIGIMVRSAEEINVTDLESKIPGLNHKLNFLKTPLIEISASDIRYRIANGKQFRYFVPDDIYHYIIKHKLYQN